MKKRNSAIIAFLLCAVLCIGIGYSAVSDRLDIQGSLAGDESAISSAFKDDVYFSASSQVTEGKIKVATQIAADTNNEPNDRVKAQVSGFSLVNDTVTFTATIKNDNPDLDASVKIIEIADMSNDYTTHYTITTDKGTDTPFIVKAGGGIETITVTITMIQTPVDAAEAAADFMIKIEATAVEA